MRKILPLVLTLCALLMGTHGARAGDTPVAKTVLITAVAFPKAHTPYHHTTRLKAFSRSFTVH